MGMTLETQLLLLCIFFLTLDTVAVGLRLYVRLRLKSASFGWDDVFLTITYVGLVLHISFMLVAIHYGAIALEVQPWHDPAKALLFSAVTCDICFVIAGTVKISVAVVIYRLLDYRPLLKAMVVADIIICCVWTVVYTLVLSLGCTATRITQGIDNATCQQFMYAQEATYIAFSIIQVVFPVALLCGTRMRRRQKYAVIFLFSLGGLSAVFVVLKILVLIEMYHPTSLERWRYAWTTAAKWALVEHGLSLFAASIIALGPIYTKLVQAWAAFSGRISLYHSSRGSSNPRDSPRPHSTLRRGRRGIDYRRRDDMDDNDIRIKDTNDWGWAFAGRRVDRELVSSASDPDAVVTVEGLRTQNTEEMKSPAWLTTVKPSYSPGRLKSYEWESWCKTAHDEDPAVPCERVISGHRTHVSQQDAGQEKTSFDETSIGPRDARMPVPPRSSM